MSQPTLHDLIVATGGRPSGGVRPGNRVGQVQTDSRLISAGDCFWALPGSSLDGHDFAGEAIRRGATCCVVQDDRPALEAHPHIVVPDSLQALADFARWNRESHEAMVIGITGSVGKTTTRHMLHAVLSSRFAGSQSPANFNNHVGVPLSLLKITDGDEFAVIEMGASATGKIARLAAIARPEAAIVTAVAPAHLEGFGSIEAIEAGKGELVAALPADGFAVLNGDDERVRRMALRAACRTILVGFNADNDLCPGSVSAANDLLSFRVGDAEFQLRAIGRHHVQAALACVAVAREIGLSDVEIARGFERFESVSGRCRKVAVGPWTVIDDTYNASPRSMAAACEALNGWRTSGRKWLVVGDMLELGADSPELHCEVGRVAGACDLDGVVAVGDRAGDVIRGARSAGRGPGQLAVCRDVSTAMVQLDCWLSPGDVILVKGSRGMKMERVIEQLKQLSSQAERPARIAA